MTNRTPLPADVAPEVASAITATVHDYYEGWFEADADRMRRALHPDLVKRSLTGESGDINSASAGDMVDATREGHGTRHAPERRGFTVSINHVYGPHHGEGGHPGAIADVHVVADVYVDYLQMVLVDGRWQILNALWAPVVPGTREA